MRKLKLILILICVTSFNHLYANSLYRYVGKSSRSKEVCNDATYLRRTYLLLTGELPKADKAESFLSSTSEDKRDELVSELLVSEPYLKYMQMRWGDILRIKSEFPSNLWPNGVQAYNSWVYHHLMANTPYDKMISELLLSTGSNFKDPAVNYFRAFLNKTPEAIYQNINLLFLGQREYTDNGYECFSQLRYKSTKEWKEEIIYLDIDQKPTYPKVVLADKTVLDFSDDVDFRKPYVEWLTENEQFAAVMVNRLWYWIFGTGLVNEPDDWRKDNPASEKKLLKHLTRYFIANGYDMRDFLHYILTSDIYQSKAEIGGFFEPRRLPAEVIVDAIADLTGVSDTYRSRVPEPFTYYPAGSRSRDLGDATVSSSALELFGKVSRDVSLESQRNSAITSMQLLYLMNNSELEQRIRQSTLIKDIFTQKKITVKDICKKLTLSILSREATEEEINLFMDYFKKSKIYPKQMAYDIMWTQLNSNEFLYLY